MKEEETPDSFLTTELMIEDFLNVKEKKVKNYWEKVGKIPLLMKKRYSEYEDNIIPMQDTFTYKINPESHFHMVIVGRTGRKKTIMMKNLVNGFHAAGYNILFFEPKKMDMVYGMYKGKGKKLPMYMENKKGLDMVSYTPLTHYDTAIDTLGSDTKKTNFFSIDIKQLTSKEMWMSFGMPFKGAEIVVDCLNNGFTDVNYMKDKIKNSKLMGTTRNTSVAVLDIYENILNNKKYPPLNLNKLWQEKKIVVINFHGKQGSDMNTIIGLVVNLAKRIGQKESNVSKKLIIFDDLFMYGGAMAYNFASQKINYAQNEIANCQYNYRSFGIDSIIAVQNLDPGSVHPTIIEGRDEFLITRTGNSEMLRSLIPFQAHFLATNQDDTKGDTLVSDKEKKEFQWIYCTEDSLEFVGYPFDCIVGHPA